MFEECGAIDRTEVVYGRDGRSRVSHQLTCMSHYDWQGSTIADL